ncbi:Neurofilament light [Balamuthia mandrillaris]
MLRVMKIHKTATTSESKTEKTIMTTDYSEYFVFTPFSDIVPEAEEEDEEEEPLEDGSLSPPGSPWSSCNCEAANREPDWEEPSDQDSDTGKTAPLVKEQGNIFIVYNALSGSADIKQLKRLMKRYFDSKKWHWDLFEIRTPRLDLVSVLHQARQRKRWEEYLVFDPKSLGLETEEEEQEKARAEKEDEEHQRKASTDSNKEQREADGRKAEKGPSKAGKHNKHRRRLKLLRKRHDDSSEEEKPELESSASSSLSESSPVATSAVDPSEETTSTREAEEKMRKAKVEKRASQPRQQEEEDDEDEGEDEMEGEELVGEEEAEEKEKEKMSSSRPTSEAASSTSTPEEGSPEPDEDCRYYDYIFIAGGDGTISWALDGMAGSRIPMGIIPFGTGNAIAQEMGIPLNTRKAIRMLAHMNDDMELIEADLIHINGTHFLLHVDIGVGAVTVEKTKSSTKKRLGVFAYVWSGMKAFFGYQPTTFFITVDGVEHILCASEVVLANSASVGLGPGYVWGQHIKPNDGIVDVCVFRLTSGMEYTHALINLLVKKHPSRDSNITYLQARYTIDVRVAGNQPIPCQGDGDLFTTLPIHATIKPAAVRVLRNKLKHHHHKHDDKHGKYHD